MTEHTSCMLTPMTSMDRNYVMIVRESTPTPPSESLNPESVSFKDSQVLCLFVCCLLLLCSGTQFSSHSDNQKCETVDVYC